MTQRLWRINQPPPDLPPLRNKALLRVFMNHLVSLNKAFISPKWIWNMCVVSGYQEHHSPAIHFHLSMYNSWNIATRSFELLRVVPTTGGCRVGLRCRSIGIYREGNWWQIAFSLLGSIQPHKSSENHDWKLKRTFGDVILAMVYLGMFHQRSVLGALNWWFIRRFFRYDFNS